MLFAHRQKYRLAMISITGLEIQVISWIYAILRFGCLSAVINRHWQFLALDIIHLITMYSSLLAFPVNLPFKEME